MKYILDTHTWIWWHMRPDHLSDGVRQRIGDPADQIIVATARLENAVILSKDERILSYGHVSSLW